MESEITMNEATSVAKKSLSVESLEVIKFELKPFSSEVQGYLSDQKMLIIEVIVKSEPNKNKTLTFFAKSIAPTVNEYNKLIFREEAKFYNDVVPQLLNHSISEPFLPKSYLVKNNIIVLENLKPQGLKVVKRILSVDQLKSALGAVARYHASSFILEKTLEKPLNEVYSGFFKEKTFINDGDFCWKWLLTGIEVAEAVGKNLNLNFSSVPAAYDLMLEKMKPIKDEKNVLCHSDLWTNNIMFAANSNELKCRLVDYQSVTYTSYIIDVLQLIYLDSLSEVRKKNEKELIQHYYSELIKNLRKNKYDVKKFMTLEEVFKDVEEKRICGLVTAVQFFPIVLLNDELSGEYGKDAEKFQEYSFKSRKDFVLKAMEKDQEYRKRLEGIVNELIDYMEKH